MNSRVYGALPEVRAGGGVVWRRKNRAVEVVLVHHSLHRDWSLPKGKQDPGEETDECAVREVLEETGMHCTPDDHVAVVHYVDRIGRSKLVHYWSMHAGDDEELHVLAPSFEIDDAQWSTVPDALPLVSFGRDRMVLWAFASSMGIRMHDTATTSVRGSKEPAGPLLIHRHASAGDRGSWSGDDMERELDAKGSTQAAALTSRVGAFPIGRIVSSPAVRCIQSVEPLSRAVGVPVEIEERLAEGKSRHVIGLLKEYKGEGVLWSTHGDILEGTLVATANAGGLPLPGDGDLRKASTWVLNGSGSSDGSEFRVAGYLAPPARR